MRHPLLIFGALVCSIVFLPACGGEKSPVRTYQMGEKVVLGHLSYTVYETQWLTQIGLEPSSRVPRHRFFLVRMTLFNNGGGTVVWPHVSIEDSKGNQYQEVSDGEGVPQWIGYIRQVQSRDSATGNLVFDAPPARYHLRISDEDEARFALIELPLTFAAETPEVMLPGSAKRPDEPAPGSFKKP